MYLSRIEIYGYGKFVNQAFNVQEGLFAFQGQNGSGKTTLMSFITSIMFGFPDHRRKNTRHYDVNPQVIYGGKLFFNDTAYGDISIERTKANGKTSLAFIDGENERHEVSDFNFLFKDLTRDDYLTLFGFSEDELLNFVWLDEETFQQAVASLAMSGQQAIMTSVVPALKQTADQLYLPNGKNPLLNQQLDQVTAATHLLEQARQEEENYFSFSEELKEKEKQLKQLQHAREKLNHQTVDMQIAAQQDDLVKQCQALAAKVENYHFIGFTPEDYRHFQSLSEQEQKLGVEAEQLARIGQRTGESDENSEVSASLTPASEWIMNHRTVASEMVAEARAYREHMNSNEALHDDIVEKRYQQTTLLKALGAESIEELPEPLSSSEETEWLQRKKDIDNRRIFYQNAKAGLEALKEQRNDLKAERSEISSDYAEFQEQSASFADSWLRTFGFIILGVGVVLLLLFLFLQQAVFVVSGSLATVIGGIIAIIGWLQHRRGQAYIENENKAYQLDLRDIDSERAEIQRQIDNQNEQLEELTKQSQEFNQALSKLIADKGGSEYIAPLVWLETDYEKQVLDLEDEINQLLSSSQVESFHQTHQAEWQSFQDSIAGEHLAYDKLYQAFIDGYATYQTYAADHQYALRANEEQADRERDLSRRKNQVAQAMTELLTHYDYDDPAFFASDIEQEMLMGQYRRELARLDEQINPDVMKYNMAQEAIEEQLTDTNDQLQRLNVQINNLVNEVARLHNQIANLAENGLVSDQKQRLQSDLDEAYHLAVDWASNQLAAKALSDQAMDGGSDRPQMVVAQASRYLNQLTNGRLEKLQFQAEGELVVYSAPQAEWFAVNQLSRGEKILLFIALRFAFIDTAMQHVPAPMMIDEAFAHLDDEYLENVYRLIKERSQDRQILLFTYDTFVDEWVDQGALARLTQ
ncbi:MAG: AAA family ATPase [Aerococcus sp.]|nr:AAA family ATPase [Aerococcus sp.]